MRLRRFVLMTALLLWTACRTAAPAARVDVTKPEDTLQRALGRIDAFIAEEQRRSRTPGISVGVIVDGKMVHTRAAGAFGVDDRRPVDAKTLFRIGSVTKTFTAMLILKLHHA